MKEDTFPTYKDTGLRFAAVVSDYNPIHLYPASAKLFGFKRPIAHGMYIAAKALHLALDVWAQAGAYLYIEARGKKRPHPPIASERVPLSLHHTHTCTRPNARTGLAYPIEIDLKFIKPCFLPGRVSCQVYRADIKKGEPRLIVLVRNAEEEEVHLQGTLRAYKA